MIFLALALIAFAFVFVSNPVVAQTVSSSTTSTTAATSSSGDKFLAAGIAFGLAALGAGFGVGTSGSAAIAAVTEKAEVRTTALIFVVLAEAIAIYGFAIAFIILGQTG